MGGVHKNLTFFFVCEEVLQENIFFFKKKFKFFLFKFFSPTFFIPSEIHLPFPLPPRTITMNKRTPLKKIANVSMLTILSRKFPSSRIKSRWYPQTEALKLRILFSANFEIGRSKGVFHPSSRSLYKFVQKTGSKN
jgi:hypothetical protein